MSLATFNRSIRKEKKAVFDKLIAQGPINASHNSTATEKTNDFKRLFPLKYLDRQQGGGAKTRFYLLGSLPPFFENIGLPIDSQIALDTFKRSNLQTASGEVKDFMDQIQSAKYPETSDPSNPSSSNFKIPAEIKTKTDQPTRKNIIQQPPQLKESASHKIENLLKTQIREKTKENEILKLKSEYSARLRSQEKEFNQRIKDERNAKENEQKKKEEAQRQLKEEMRKTERLIAMEYVIDNIKKKYQSLTAAGAEMFKRIANGEKIKIGDFKKLASTINNDVVFDLKTKEYTVIDKFDDPMKLKDLPDDIVIAKRGGERLFTILLFVAGAILICITLLFWRYIYLLAKNP